MAKSSSAPSRPQDRPWSYDETWMVALDTTNAIHKLSLNCCFFGGMGSRLHGNTRDPNDIDIIILNILDDEVEAVKQTLEATYACFYRKPSPSGRYQILWYKIDDDHSCKVDLLPSGGSLCIPVIPPERIEHRPQQILPVAPFSVVFLLRLQGWWDHRSSPSKPKREKQYQDHEDIERMLDIALAQGILPLEDPIHKSGIFCQKARRRVMEYTKVYSETCWKWKDIGFPVSLTSLRRPYYFVDRNV